MTRCSVESCLLPAPGRGLKRVLAAALGMVLLGAAPPDYAQIEAGDVAWDGEDRRTAREQ